MSASAIAALVLGSSVVAGVLGAWLKSVTERSAAFRERLVTASVDFLAAVARTRDAVRHARRAIAAAIGPSNGEASNAAQAEVDDAAAAAVPPASKGARGVRQASASDGDERPPTAAERADAALSEIDEAVSVLWASVPLLVVVFPTEEVSDAARELTSALEQTRTKLEHDWRHGTISDFGNDSERIDELHHRYADLVRRDIRRGAYRRFRLPRRRRKDARRRGSPVPPLRSRLLGPRRAEGRPRPQRL